MDKFSSGIFGFILGSLFITFVYYRLDQIGDKFIDTELQQYQTQLADNTDRVADVIKNDELLRDYADCIYKQVATNKDLDLCDPYYDMAVEFNNLIFKDSEDGFIIVTE